MTDSYVAFLDILGFSNMVIKQNAEDQILNILHDLSDKDSLRSLLYNEIDINENQEENHRIEEKNKALDEASIYMMSDSVVISTPSDLPYALEILIEVCMAFQIKLLSLEHPILMRGAIAKGDYYNEDRIAFGKAMVEAVRFEEEYSKYPRIIITTVLANKVLEHDFITRALRKDIEGGFYYIDSLKNYFLNRSLDDPKIRRFEKIIDNYLEHYENERVREKYLWLNNELTYIKNLSDFKSTRKNKNEATALVDHIIDDDSIQTLKWPDKL